MLVKGTTRNFVTRQIHSRLHSRRTIANFKRRIRKYLLTNINLTNMGLIPGRASRPRTSIPIVLHGVNPIEDYLRFNYVKDPWCGSQIRQPVPRVINRIFLLSRVGRSHLWAFDGCWNRWMDMTHGLTEWVLCPCYRSVLGLVLSPLIITQITSHVLTNIDQIEQYLTTRNRIKARSVCISRWLSVRLL